jgi:hypothetical protein
MVQSIKTETHKCDCGKGTLEELSKTILFEPTYMDTNEFRGYNGETSQTIFYKCDSCKDIYKRDMYPDRAKSEFRTTSTDENGNHLNKNGNIVKQALYGVDDFIVYKGPLTEQEIINKVPEWMGILNHYHEKVILLDRNGSRQNPTP